MASTLRGRAGRGVAREARKLAQCLRIASQQVPPRINGDPAASSQRSAQRVSYSGQRRPPSLASRKLESRDAFFIGRVLSMVQATNAVNSAAAMEIVVVGHGMVGHKFVESILADGAPNARVTVLCEEPRPAYDRVHLSEFFAGKSADDLSLVAPGFFDRENVRLVLATGSSAFVPPIAGNDRADCFVYRTIADLEAMQARGARAKSGVVVGGGLLGLECAKALRDMGLQTHVVEFAPRLMAVQVDEAGGRVLRNRIEA